MADKEREKVLEAANKFINEQNPFAEGQPEIIMRKHWLLEFLVDFHISQSEWVDVNDRLPTGSTGVWVTTDNGVTARAYFYDGRFNNRDGDWINVVAWMANPFPAPFVPQEKK